MTQKYGIEIAIQTVPAAVTIQTVPAAVTATKWVDQPKTGLACSDNSIGNGAVPDTDPVHFDHSRA